MQICANSRNLDKVAEKRQFLELYKKLFYNIFLGIPVLTSYDNCNDYNNFIN